MKLRKKDVWQLSLLGAVAALLALMLRTTTPVGINLAGNPLVEAVRQDAALTRNDNPAADVTLIVFTDYRCPACRRAHPEMKRAVARDEKVRVVYKDWPIFGDASERAARVAVASSFQGIYPAVHDRLMTGPVLGEATLGSAVIASGGDWRSIQRDLAGRAVEIDGQLRRNGTQALGLGLGGTPGYLIGPILVRGALTEAQFTRAIRAARQAR